MPRSSKAFDKNDLPPSESGSDNDEKSTEDDDDVSAKQQHSEEFSCPHCSRTFTSALGLNYHVKNFVCRPESRPGGPKKRGRPTKKEQSNKQQQLAANKELGNSPARSSPRKKQRTIDVDSSSGEDDGSNDEDDDTNSETESGDRKPNKAISATGSSDWTCPHCGRLMGSAGGLHYHVNNFVCRPKERPGGPAQRGRRKKGEASSSIKYKRVRGTLADRTCPKCKRVFTSTLGLNYHVEKKVCELKKADAQLVAPYGVLQPGEQFVTEFGVVEVVVDNRAVPSGEPLPTNVKELYKTWTNKKAKREARVHTIMEYCTATHLATRIRLNELFESGSMNAKSVNTVYSAYRAKEWGPELAAVTSSIGPDPTCPPGSFSDRIVECRLIADERKRFYGPPESDEEALSAQHGTSMRLFLRRSFLTETYNRESCIYMCHDCGREYGSVPGLKYHLQAQACAKTEDNGAAKRERLQSLQQKAEDILEEESKPTKSRSQKHWGRSVEDMPMYPQVLVALGYHMLPSSGSRIHGALRDGEGRRSALGDVIVGQKDSSDDGSSDSGNDDDDATKLTEIQVENPNLVLRELERQIRIEQSKLLGPMYKGVFASLQYKPAVIGKRKADIEQKATPKKKRARKLKSSTNGKPPPPAPMVVDTRVLLNEVETGRYPSIKKDESRVHENACSVCKQEEGDLLYCDFCPKAVHFPCMLEKLTVKGPEPGDDFICNACIMYIHHRRLRAEKRRVEKGGAEVQKEQKEADARLVNEIVEGREYECLAAQARRVDDLVVLLRDAQSRLSDCVETAKINAVRYSMIAPSEKL